MEQTFCDIHTHHPRADRLSPTEAGIHPWDAERGFAMPDFVECDIIGETGLDYACAVDREAQENLFRGHLAEAERSQKPVVIHAVKAFEPVMKILSEYHLCSVLFHGFIGSVEQAKRCFAKGYFLSFGERSLRSPRTREVIASAPAENIFLETDDNADCDLEALYREVAEIRKITIEELRRQTIENYEKLIQLR